MAGLPVGGLCALPESTGSVINSPVDFTSTTNCASLWIADMSRASMTPTLSAKDFLAGIVDYAAASPSLSKPHPPAALQAHHDRMTIKPVARPRHEGRVTFVPATSALM